MPKAVIDTSVFIAGLLSKDKLGSSSQILSMWRAGAFTLVMSPQIFGELVARLIEKEIPENIILDLITIIGKIALRIPGAYESTRLDEIDAADNKFLAAAYESKADYLVSYDKKSLLLLKHFHGTTVCLPPVFLRVLYGLAEEEQEDQTYNEKLKVDELKQKTLSKRRKESGLVDS